MQIAKDPYDLIVVGGGAAGVFCAVNAAGMRPGLQVVVIERSAKLLAKVRVSGGGRCNVTHDCQELEAMSRCYPRGARFIRKAFHQFFTCDTIQWFRQRGVALVTEPDGRMFPSTNRSETIVGCLLQEAERLGVAFQLQADLVSLQPTGDGFRLSLRDGQMLSGRKVCIASGGMRSQGPSWLSDLGHSLVEPVPSLFTFNLPGHDICGLTGLSVADAGVRVEGSKAMHRGALLITHWGLSGPAILKASAWEARSLHGVGYCFPFQVQWLAGHTLTDVNASLAAMRKHHGSAMVWSKSIFPLPLRLWQFLATMSGITQGLRWADMTASQRDRLSAHLLSHRFQADGQTVFKEEFVTAGGISTQEVEASTMESRKMPGLYFAGEVLDVDGITGGYNFQHAWTSGWVAAAHISRSLL